MFQVGDKVFCPLRGAGVVEAVEQRSMLGEVHEYVVIGLLGSRTTVMIPTDRIATSGFRFISNDATVEAALELVADKDVEIDKSIVIKERLKENKLKLAAGKLEDYGQIIRNLSYMQREKSLNTSENTILMTARKLFLEELSLVKEISLQEAGEMLDELLA